MIDPFLAMMLNQQNNGMGPGMGGGMPGGGGMPPGGGTYGGMPPGTGGGGNFNPSQIPANFNNVGFTPANTGGGFSAGSNSFGGMTNFNPNIGTVVGEGITGFDYGPGLGGRRRPPENSGMFFTPNGQGDSSAWTIPKPDGFFNTGTGLSNKPDGVNNTTNVNIVTDPTLGNKNNGGSTNGPGDTPMPIPPQPLPPSNSRIYTRIDYNNDVVEQTRQIITKGLWGNITCGVAPTGSMFNFFTASYQNSTQKKYYYDVNITPNANKCDVEFSIAYGHYQGSGSFSGGGQLNDSPSRAIYSQYMLLSDQIQNNKKFQTPAGVDIDDVYVINIAKSRLKDKFDPGNWQLSLSELNGGAHGNQFYTGSNVSISGSGKLITLVDDSLDSDEAVSTGGITQPYYNVYSGSISNGVFSTGSHFGYVYPDLGVILLSATRLNTDLSFNTVVATNIEGDNSYKLFTSISGSGAPVVSTRPLTYSFDARNVKLKTTAHYFLRVRNNEYNFSNNPTFVTGSEGEFKHSTFIRDPRTYITSIGMYNDRYELLAVAKMSKPILKSFVNETSITLKLEY